MEHNANNRPSTRQSKVSTYQKKTSRRLSTNKTLRKSHSSLLKDPFLLVKNSISAYNSSRLTLFEGRIVNLLENRPCSLVAVFKESMIDDYRDEFLKRSYNKREQASKLPKIINYYKNYLKFFCKPYLHSTYVNSKLKKVNEVKAQIYYKQNYDQEKEAGKAVPKDLSRVFSESAVESIDQFRISNDSLTNELSKEDLLNRRNPINEDKTFLKEEADFRLESIANILSNLEESKVELQLKNKFGKIKNKSTVMGSTSEKTKDFLTSTNKSYKNNLISYVIDAEKKENKPQRLRKMTPSMGGLRRFSSGSIVESAKNKISVKEKPMEGIITGTATKFRKKKRKTASYDANSVKNAPPSIYRYKDLYSKIKKKPSLKVKSTRNGSLSKMKVPTFNEQLVNNYQKTLFKKGKKLEVRTSKTGLETGNLKFSVRTAHKRTISNRRIEFPVGY